MFDLSNAQHQMKTQSIDAWLVHDFRRNNPVMTQIVGDHEATRRCILCFPQTGEPLLILHRLDKEVFAKLGFSKRFYTTWQELRLCLAETLQPYSRVAMEYSPGAAIPTMAIVDSGTVEVVRSQGIEVVSSADLFQIAAASWDESALTSHRIACHHVNEIKDLAFAMIASSIRAGTQISEYDVQQLIHGEFRKRNLETEDNAIVAVNSNSGNPHYEPSEHEHMPIKAGDWILIDLWARQPGHQNVFGDITWVAVAAAQPTEKQLEVFRIVKDARDLVVEELKDAWKSGRRLQGWQLDAVARRRISESNFGEYFTHRTGHSIGPGVRLHALGVNLDGLETNDTRQVMPGIGFSVEPGIYLPDFGIRLEINVFMHPVDGVVIATPIQNEIVCLS